jgi:hypothetical protein
MSSGDSFGTLFVDYVRKWEICEGKIPTTEPTAMPSIEPSYTIPTFEPTAEQSAMPSIEPTNLPTEHTTEQPTEQPTSHSVQYVVLAYDTMCVDGSPSIPLKVNINTVTLQQCYEACEADPECGTFFYNPKNTFYNRPECVGGKWCRRFQDQAFGAGDPTVYKLTSRTFAAPTPAPTEHTTEQPTEQPSDRPTDVYKPTDTPTEEPTPGPTPDTGDSNCLEDDVNWSFTTYKDKVKRCNWVAANPFKRCKKRNAWGVSAWKACEATCDPGAPKDDPTWRKQNWSTYTQSKNKNCWWVAKSRSKRCKKPGKISNGKWKKESKWKNAMLACAATCSPACLEKHKGGNN